MSAKARITADFATQNDVASRLRIPASRTDELRRQMFDLQIKKADGSVIFVEMNKSDLSRRKSSRAVTASRVSRAKKK
jgi:hypothetical protein